MNGAIAKRIWYTYQFRNSDGKNSINRKALLTRYKIQSHAESTIVKMTLNNYIIYPKVQSIATTQDESDVKETEGYNKYSNFLTTYNCTEWAVNPSHNPSTHQAIVWWPPWGPSSHRSSFVFRLAVLSLCCRIWTVLESDGFRINFLQSIVIWEHGGGGCLCNTLQSSQPCYPLRCYYANRSIFPTIVRLKVSNRDDK